MSADASDEGTERAERLIWPPRLWPAPDRLVWDKALKGKGPDGFNNPATGWRPRTAKKNEDGYGRYLSWLHSQDLWAEAEPVTQRVARERVIGYIAYLKSFLAPASVGVTVGALCSAVRARAGSRLVLAEPPRDPAQAQGQALPR